MLEKLYGMYSFVTEASDKHFAEVGHLLESRTGPGLAKTLIHFN